MPTTVDFPTIVKQALELFGDVFDNEVPHRAEGGRAQNISAINRQFAIATDQS